MRPRSRRFSRRRNFGVIGCTETAPDLWSLADGFGQAVKDLRAAADAVLSEREAEAAAALDPPPAKKRAPRKKAAAKKAPARKAAPAD